MRRLAHELTPIRYNLKLDINSAMRKFFGDVSLEFYVSATASDLTVHAKNLAIRDIKIDGRPSKWELNEETDELKIESKTDIFVGQHTLNIVYEGEIKDQLHGIYPCNYNDQGSKKELYVTQFESHHAREAFPCIDEPEAKAEFDLTLTTDVGVKVLSNTNAKSSSEVDGRLVTSFETTPKMSTYLLAWVIGQLQSKTGTTRNNVQVSVWSTPTQDSTTLDFALATAVSCIEFYESYFGIRYPLEKCDLVALPDFSSGAMENWGLITFRETALLVDPLNSSIPMRQMVALVIAHEMAHQWFGNLVTMRWWDDLWLNESFATIMEYIAVNNLFPDWKIWLDFSANDTLSALRRDRITGVQAVRTGVEHPDEISTLFDPSIVYAKGAKLMQMLFNYVGETAWRAGLKDYFKQHAFGNTSAEDLWKSLSNASGREVGIFMIPWLERPGYPMVSLTRHPKNQYVAKQHRFLSNPSARAADHSAPWPIPLLANQSVQPELFHSESAIITASGGNTLKLNSLDRALFITHYEEPLHRLELKRDVIDGKLEEADRLQLLNEMSLLSSGGVASQVDVLELLAGYQNEDDQSVWQAIAMVIRDTRKLIEYDEELLDKLRKYVALLIERSYARLGWDKKPGESDFDTMLRTTILHLGIFARYEPVLAEAKRRFANFTRPEEIPADIRVVIYQAGAKFGTPEDFNKLLDLYNKTDFAEEKANLRAGLLSTEDESKIEFLLTKLKDPNFSRAQDFLYWFSGFMGNKYARPYMWLWLQDEWSEWITEKFANDKSYDMFPRIAASEFITNEDLNAYTKFFSLKMAEPALKRSIEIGIQDITSKNLWQKRDFAKIKGYLSKH